MKGLHEMKKCHQALLRYLNMDLLTTMETFKGFISDEGESRVTVPYRPSLDFILIRFQGLAKLLIRIVSCAKQSVAYFLGLIKAGSFYAKGIVMIGTLASVWSLSREFCKFLVRQYKGLKEFREKLKEKRGLKWVDVEYELPDDLDVWLGDEWTILIDNETYDARLLVKDVDIANFLTRENVLSRLKDDDDGAVADDEPSQDIIRIDDNNPNDQFELEDYAPIPRTVKKEAEADDSPYHSTSSFTSKDSVMRFIKNETSYRKVDPQKSLTISKMKKKVWKEFRDDINNKSILMQDKAFINYVKDFLEEYKL